MVIFGVDPGLRRLGWGVIRAQGSRFTHIASGSISAPTDLSLGERLLTLHAGLADCLQCHNPDAAAIEQTFVNRDGAGTLKLGQARGVALLALAQAGLAVGEYAPNAVKKTVVGVGHADKVQVLHMIKVQLAGADPDSHDAADALAIALCHAVHVRSRFAA